MVWNDSVEQTAKHILVIEAKLDKLLEPRTAMRHPQELAKMLETNTGAGPIDPNTGGDA